VVGTVLLLVGVSFPVVVAVSRVARGMHHPIDVVAGLLLGAASILVVRIAIGVGVEQIDHEATAAPMEHSTMPLRVRRLDLTDTESGAAGDGGRLAIGATA
jgi:hypothetical protein